MKYYFLTSLATNSFARDIYVHGVIYEIDLEQLKKLGVYLV
jgi:hypothetical protein